MILQYNNRINEGKSASESINAITHTDTGEIIKLNRATESLIEGANGAKVSEQALSAALKEQTLASKAASVGMQLLSSALNMVVVAAVSWGISKAIEALDDLIHAQDRLEEKVVTSKEAYDENRSTIESLNSELDNTRQLMDELNGKDTLTVVEKEQLSDLEQQNALLQQQIDLAERRSDILLREQRQDVLAAGNGLIRENTGFEKGELIGYDGFAGMPIYATSNDQNDLDYKIKTFKETQDALSKARLELVKSAGNASAEEQQATIDRIGELEATADSAETEINAVLSRFDSIIGDNERIKNPNYEWEKSYNAIFDYRDKIVDALLYSSNNTIADVTSVLADRYAEPMQKIQEIVEERGAITAEQIETSFGEIAATYKQAGYGIETAAQHLTEQFASAIPSNQTESSSSMLTGYQSKASSLSAALYSTTEEYETLSKAMDEQASSGKLSIQTYNELIAANSKFSGFLEQTTTGWKLNTEAVNEFIQSQDELERSQALGAIQSLQELLNSSDLTNDESSAIQSLINQYAMLVDQIDNARGAYQAWIDAQNTSDQGAVFDQADSMYEYLNENRKVGRTGTDDFKAAVGFMLGEDWESQIGTVYKSLDEAYAQAEKIGKRYFGNDDPRTGMNNFAKDVEKLGLGKIEEGIFSLNDGVTLDNLVQSTHLSADAILSILGKMEEYGAEFDFGTILDGVNADIATAVNDAEAQAAKLDELITSLQAERDALQTQLDSGALTGDAADDATAKIAELNRQIDALGYAKDGSTFGKTSEELATIQEQIDDLNISTISIPIEFTGDRDMLDAILNKFGLNGDYRLDINHLAPMDSQLNQPSYSPKPSTRNDVLA